MNRLNVVLAFLFLAIVANAQWIKQPVETKSSFRGLSVVSERVVWASGTGGTVIRTTDGGKTWNVMTVPGAEKLDFRDIEAFDANTAYILSIGSGDASRIYKTSDGGKTWELQFSNKDEKAFYDALACWRANHCLAMSDPVNGRFRLIRTLDGLDWDLLPESKLPIAAPGEAAFAASGTCLYINPASGDIFLVSGGAKPRVFRSSDGGDRWFAIEAPIVGESPASGIFSIAFVGKKTGIVVGGNYEKPDDSTQNLALSRDGGKNWTPAKGLSGYRSAVAYIDRKTIIAVGTNGGDISRDGGITWTKIGSENLNAVAARGRNAIWAVGPAGMVVKLKLR